MKKSAMRRSARYPDRIHSSASTSRGTSRTAVRKAAESSTAPAAVIQEWSGWGDRKNTSTENDVWVSSMSTNHISISPQVAVSRSNRSRRHARVSSSKPVGGLPARTSSLATMASRRLKEP